MRALGIIVAAFINGGIYQTTIVARVSIVYVIVNRLPCFRTGTTSIR
jgi:hypothetical protein